MEVEDSLSFDEVPRSDEVVARPKPCHFDRLSERLEHCGNTAESLANVDNDRRHAASVAADLCRLCI
jgi:hypothetical protein